MNTPQQHAADPKASAWVAANAGSGKTFVLISRLVTLMLSGSSPDKLLCLTYTRGAAAEMQGRLFDLLSGWALLSDEKLADEIKERTGLELRSAAALDHARTLFASALESPGGLKIQTIHAFCEALLHRFPLEAGLAPGFQLLDEFEAGHIIEGIAHDLAAGGDEPVVRLHHDADDTPEADRAEAPISSEISLSDAVHLLARHLPADQFSDLAHVVVAARSRFILHDEQMSAFLDEILPVRSKSLIDADRRELESELVQLIQALGATIQELGTATDQKNWAKLAALHQANSSKVSLWAALEDYFLTQKGEKRKSLVTAAIRRAQPDAVDRLGAGQDKFYDLAEEDRVHHSRDLTTLLHRYARAVLTRYAAYKERHQRLDYDDLIDRVNRLLQDSSAAAWVLFKIDAGIDHILVDEAQDTSPSQWRVIKALADEFFSGASGHHKDRTIFAVGDEKQSIFSFQGADPKEFERMRGYFEQRVTEAELSFKQVALSESRRSTPQILEAVDLTFSAPPARAGLTALGGEVLHTAFRDHEVGYVELWPLMESEASVDDTQPWEMPAQELSLSGRQRLAQRIAEKVSTLLENPAISAQDILILVRQRNAFFVDILRALRQYQVPIAGADRMKLLDELVVKDLCNIADCALNPMNDLAIAIFLRGPFGDISEPELFALAHRRDATLLAAIADRVAQGAASSELKAAYRRLLWLCEQGKRLSPFDYFSQFLSVQGGQALLYRRLGFEVDDAVGEFLRLALSFERQHPESLQLFIDWLSGNATEVKREFEQDVNAVRVMTVHGAKGLEAPIVFLPDGCRLPSRANRGNVAIHADQLRWQARQRNMSRFDRALLADRQQDDFAESQRLLYVALTRARDRLYIGGYLPANMSEPDPQSWYAQLAALKPAQEGDILWAIGDEASAGPVQAEKEKTIIPTVVRPDWLNRSVDMGAQAPIGTDIQIEREEAVAVTDLAGRYARSYISEVGADPLGAPTKAGSARDGAALDGIFIHRLLQFLPQVAASERGKTLRSLTAHYVKQGHAAQTKAAAALEARIIREVEAVLDVQSLAPLFTPSAKAELKLVGKIHHHFEQDIRVTGQIDRFVQQGNEIWIADFKTGTPHGPHPAYHAQMAIYRYLLQKATGISAVRCSLIWTQTQQIEDFDAAALDEVMDRIQNMAS